MELFQASQQWASRPNDERFVNLDEMFDFASDQMAHSRAIVKPANSIWLEPTDEGNGLLVKGETTSFAPTNWAFSQLCQRVGAPADYLRDKVPNALAADCLNFQYKTGQRDEIGMLLYHNGGAPELRAVTGPNYGRIWNAEIIDELRKRFGNGMPGNGARWHIPGEFNRHDKPVTKESTTLYAGDRDMFAFLCDSTNTVEIPNRRNGETGHMLRGFFAWNSEVGSRSAGWATFLYDYMCGNHIVWGATEYDEVRIRHTVSAPDKWLDEMIPALQSYANGSTDGITQAIAAARAKVLGDKTAEFLANRFGPRKVQALQTVHMAEEGRPIETVFDVVTAATALAKQIPWIGPRVELEREAGKLLVAA